MLFSRLVDNLSAAGRARPAGLEPFGWAFVMKQVPFFASMPDDTRCAQASFRIMLKYFLPERDFSYRQLDKLSQGRPGKGTWWPPLLPELQKLWF